MKIIIHYRSVHFTSNTLLTLDDMLIFLKLPFLFVLYMFQLFHCELYFSADDDEESDRKCVKAFRQYFLVNETFEHSTYCLNCSR